MSELISGKEALSRVYSGKVQYMSLSKTQDRWTTITDHYYPQYHLGMFLDEDTEFKFRLKPHTISINGIEVPAPFEPKHGEIFWHIDVREICSYNYKQEWCDSDEYLQLGAWRTEEEIKQVVAALRSVFEATP